jgi:uncharacterized protein (DUF1501 family)
MWTRRDVLRLAALSAPAAALGALACGRRRRSARASPAAPRYFVVLCLGGGIDPILTTDPKTRSEVDAAVDLPYGPSEIVESGGLRLGPHFAPLARWASRMAVLNGVQVGTANHVTGFMQALRMRTRVSPEMPGLLDVIGHHRHGQPLGCVSFGALQRHDHSPGWIDGNVLFERLNATAPSATEREAMGGALRRQAAGLRSGASCDECGTTAANLEETAAFFERLPGVPAAPDPPWPGDQMGKALERVVWLLERDLSRCAYVKVARFEWDSHNHNLTRQARTTARFVPAFDRFLEELSARRNSGGTLAEQTVVVVSSEVGRFPLLNGSAGKDHFPELPYLFLGPGIRTGGGAFGPTGRMMEARGQGGRKVVLDDVGTTMLRLAGLDPSPYGYEGEALRFLLADG